MPSKAYKSTIENTKLFSKFFYFLSAFEFIAR